MNPVQASLWADTWQQCDQACEVISAAPVCKMSNQTVILVLHHVSVINERHIVRCDEHFGTSH